MKFNWRAWAGHRSLRQRVLFLGSALTIVIFFQNCSPGFETMKLASVTPLGSNPIPDVQDPTTADPTVNDVPVDPNASLSIYARSAAVLEGGEIKFRLELNKASTLPVVLSIRTVAASAIANTHFVPLTDTVTIPVGQTVADVSIQTLMPNPSVANTSFGLEITNASVGGIAQRTATGLIRASRQILSFKQVSIGDSHTCGVTLAQGRVYCWGRNASGELGIGNLNPSLAPREVPGLVGIKQVSTGAGVTCAITATDSLKCWGQGQSGQLGNGIRANSSVPVDASNVSDAVVKVSAQGGQRTCILTALGEVKCWGYLGAYFPPSSGTGTAIVTLTPRAIPGISGAKDLSSGGVSSCAINGNDTISCWTWTVVDATTANPTVTAIANTAGAKRLASGTNHACFVTATNTVSCWGDDSYNQLGYFRANPNVPAEVPGVTGVKDVSAGYAHTCAVLNNETLKCWGNTSYGQLGMGYPGYTSGPVDVPNVNGVKQLAIGRYATCVIGSNDDVRCWGDNSLYQLGPVGLANSALPAHIPNLVGAKHVSAGFDHTCAVTALDSVVCWGSNIVGQLGGLNGNGSYVPYAVPGPAAITSVALGRHHSCGLTATGGVTCWGQGLATGNAPTGVATPIAGIIGAKQVVAGEYFTCIRTATDGVQCWGNNSVAGQGNGSFINSATPVTIAGLNGVKQIAAGGARACAITSTDTVQCWGDGPLGTGANGNSATPVDVVGLSGVRQIAVGVSHICTLNGENLARCWGSNREGQLGDGTLATALAPVAVQGIAGLKQIAVTNGTTCAITATDTVKCWGSNTAGEFGDGRFTSSGSPVDALHLTRIRQLSGNGLHFTALGFDGRVRRFGMSSSYVTAAGLAVSLTAPPPAAN